MPILEGLRRSRMCEGLDDESLARVAARTSEVVVAPGEFACVQNEPVTQVLIVASGRLRATAVDSDGHEQALGYFETGDHFGEVALAGSGRYAATGQAVTATHLLAIKADDWHQLLAETPQMVRNVIRSLGGRLKDAYGLAAPGNRGRATAVVHASSRGPVLWQIIGEALTHCGERWTAFEGGTADLASAAARERLRAMRADHDRVVLEVGAQRLADMPLGWLAECSEVLWLIEPRDAARSQVLWRRLADQEPEAAARLQVVWLLGAHEVVAPRDGLPPALKTLPATVELAESPQRPTRRQQQGVARLVRRLRGIRLGIALAGGGARGMAHLGVLRALDRAGIGFDVMSGTSCGAMVGIMYAAGYEPDFCIQSFARDLTPSPLFRWIPRGKNWYLLAKFRTRAFDGMLRPYLHDWTLEQLPIPFRAMTVDLIGGCEVIRERGDAVHAILESINLPMMARPIRRQGMMLIDGGILNNLPADVLRRQGCDLVVGVGVSTRLREEFAGSRPGTPTENMRQASSLETFFRVADLQARGITAIHARSADLMIEPDTSPFDFADFTRAAGLADAGEAAAEAALPRLQTLLAEIDRRATAALRSGLA